MFTRKLALGAFGHDVRDIHRLLLTNNISVSSDEMDRGFFGPTTRAAVCQWQKRNGLPVTGEVDDRTAAAMDRLGLETAAANKPEGPPATAHESSKVVSSPLKIEAQSRFANGRKGKKRYTPAPSLDGAARTIKPAFPEQLKLGDPANVRSAGKPVGEIQSALLKLKLEVKPSDLARKEMGDSTIDAIKTFQARAGLPADGRLTQDTVAKLNAEVAHNFVAQSKVRTQRLQGFLQQVGQQLDADEIVGRRFGPSTERALKAVQVKLGVPQDGRITEDLFNKVREDALKTKLSTKTQVAEVQRTLLRALNIGKLSDVRVDTDELKSRKIGPSTRAAIKAVQTKYGLPATGELDASTYDRLTSIAVSIPQPVRLLKARTAAELKPLKKTARLNMKSDHVGDVQSALAFLGFKIIESEFKSKVFGKSTRAAVVSYQEARGLAVTGHAAADTLDSLNREIQRANPGVVAGEFRYRVRGSVRNELWVGIAGAKVELWEKLTTTEGAKLAERTTLANGFFDILYDPPRETTTKQIKKPFSLVLKAFEPGGAAIGARVLFNPTQIAWANFTQGDQPYRGVSVFEERVKAVTKAAAVGSIANLVETPQDRQISQAAQAAGLLPEDVMQLVLASKVAAALNAPGLTPEACYAYLAQNLPPDLSGDLIAETKDWTLIDELVNKAVNGLVFMDGEAKAVAFDNAITTNLMPISVGRQKDAIQLALATLKQQFALEKPILVGNSSLKVVLQSSKVAAASYSKVADAFLAHRSFGESFWEDVNARPGEFGGAEALADLKTTIQVGQVTKNFTPMLKVLKQKMADVQDPSMNTARDLAKLTVDQWVEIIAANGSQVPENTDAPLGDPVRTYAATLANTSERMFPDVAFVAEVSRSQKHSLGDVAKVQDLMDKNPDLDLRSSNIDGYVKAKNLVVDDTTLTGARVLQRVNQIAPSATTGRVLVENAIHSSAQIVGMGQEQFIAAVTKDQAVDPRAARTMYRVAEARYANVLQRLTDYRFELHQADPRAIVKHTYTKEELVSNFGIPNLDTLFGSLDYCACEHCRSVYGPAAYLADVLRFLGTHPSEVEYKSVADLFFARRPDVRKIKLNCKNTSTPLPYVDLVNEVLESAVDAPQPSPTFDFQSTKSAAELRAVPENLREAAYDKLRGTDFPLTLSFDLWQEQARVFLQHLGVPRWELMEAYQARHLNTASVPLDSSVAGEFWGMSTHETQLVTTQGDATEAKQRTFWGFGNNAPLPNSRPVSDFMRRSGLTYQLVLELIYVEWVNPGTDPSPLAIERPEATCDTDLQNVVNITVAGLDKIHRFLRLWRHTSWQMWELDLLLRASRIGNSVLDSTCLARLQKFSQLQKRLNLTVEQGLALFGDINTQVRVRHESPKEKVESLYDSLFLRRAVISPIDPAFQLPLAAAKLDDHKGTPLAAFGISEADLVRILKTLADDDLTLANLSKIARYAWLGQGLSIPVKDLLAFEALTGVADIFASPKVTLDFIDQFDWIKKVDSTVEELDYLLRQSPASPLGLREEVIVQLADALRDAIRADKTGNGFDLQLISWGDGSGVPASGKNLVVVGTDNNGLLHIRIFDATGNRTKDTDEMQLPAQAAAIATLKQQLPGIWPPHVLTDTEKERVIREATSIAGQAPDNKVGIAVSQVASALQLTNDQAKLLVETCRINGKPVLQVLGDAEFLKTDDKGKFVGKLSLSPQDRQATMAKFGDVFTAYRLLHKAALVVARFKLDAINLKWLLANAGAFQLPALDNLPVSAASGAPLFPQWLNLAKLTWFKNLYPEPEAASLRAVLDLARVAATPQPEIEKAIASLTQWETQEVTDLVAALDLKQQRQQPRTSDFMVVDNYVRMHEARQLARRAGVAVSKAAAWAQRDTEANNAQKLAARETRQAAKAKYDVSTWLEKVTPLEDTLREKRRDALIAYLMGRSQTTVAPTISQDGKIYANPEYFRDANDLLKYFLIDVEMCACQLTSRIKQAISSVQMFVQRCLLGLEQPRVEVSRTEQQDQVSENSWRQWKWMRNYRVWEANRKVFLYPENWIEPELRDDKSPLFKELEEELLQSDITDETAEQALLRYLEKVHEVSRLDIVGAHYELENTDPNDDLPQDINRLHVIGRTRAHPTVYFYRSFDLNYGEWTAWEKINLEIESDQVVPVIYNRRLHLFWLSFLEKPQKVKRLPAAQPSTNVGNPEPPTMFEVQLCWSARVDDGWTPKKLSKQKLIHPWQRPRYSYNLKPRYKSLTNLLWMDVYLSQSPAFNSARFWDAYRSTFDFVTARHPYDAKARPWHASSFVFDGEVVDVRMRSLTGQYHVLGADGLPNESLAPTDSLQYVRDNFGDVGRAINGLAGANQIAPRLPLPDGMLYKNTKLTNEIATNSSRANVLEKSQLRTLLNGAITPFEIVASQHRIRFDTADWGEVPFFYQDPKRVYFIKPEVEEILIGSKETLQRHTYTFYPFYHPYTAVFMRELRRSGVEGLLNRRIQTTPQDYYPNNGFDFSSYKPAQDIARADPKTAQSDRVDFERYGAYALYNWELFFHAPLMVACKLSQNQRFEDAMRWFHFIFDPTNVESPNVPQRYWVTRPFFETNSDQYRKQRIENLLKNIDANRDQLAAWKNNPFKPHLIARYRPVAYQKAVVMKYIDNLIAWGDQLFRRDTIEAINEATTLYVLAYEILGPRPVKVPNVDHPDKSYEELTQSGKLDVFGNKQVEILMENYTDSRVHITRTQAGTEPLPVLSVSYFGIPNNDLLLAYWDQVEDRLYKIRHCMNIQGVIRQLPLFEAPIDPALLVKAAAAGVDISSALADLSVPAPPYRFRISVQKAQELCGAVRALGDKLLAALEKSDGEALALLRSTHELSLLKAVREVRKQQIKDATESMAGLQKTRLLAEQRKSFYEGREFINAGEGVALALGGASALAQTGIALGYILAGGLTFIPQFVTGASGFGGSPHVTVEVIDGIKFSKASELAVTTLSAIATALDKVGSLASTMGGYQRRQDDWTFQARQAATEIEQIDRQIASADIKIAIAEKELDNHDLQIDQSKSVDEYMRNKYTNKQLYDWQVRQVSAVYFQAYQLAYDMAKRAEKCLQHERADPTATFVQFGYWDSLKSGLLAGDRLANDISRMEAAFLTQNNRELELTKHISLVQYLPLALLALKEAGSSTVRLPEWLFDMDYPGHYFRRLKSVSLSIPSVIGPYTSVNCKLTLLKSGIRVNNSVAGGYGDPLAGADTGFYQSAVSQDAIATSHGQNDAGMFEVNFNDERYLPFEGAGAVSEWKLELPRENNQFDVSTIADVILHVRYTARDSGDTKLITAARNNLRTVLPTSGVRLFVLNREFASEWSRFLGPGDGNDQVLKLTLGREHLPFYARDTNKTITLTKVVLVADNAVGKDCVVELITPGQTVLKDVQMNHDSNYGDRATLSKADFPTTAALLGNWEIKIKLKTAQDSRSLTDGELGNTYLVLAFDAKSQP